MKLFFILLLLFFEPVKEKSSLETVRSLFAEAVNDKMKALELIKYIDMYEKAPISYGYSGASKMLMAKFEFNVFAKYKYFQEGKNDIERAIHLDPESIELRYLRFSCQSNLPWFLNYKCSIETDKQILINSILHKVVIEENIRRNIIEVLSKSSSCTNSEKRTLMMIQ